ncbi:MAG TPA: shikimate kinase [Candidatus Dormibacteraeota bacterium]|nr:shikimate kinase [Candidatus Dormibacteraeota bacterium]
MGSGKSAVGVLVAQRAGAVFHDLDLLIESEAGMTISELFATRGEAAFRALESRLLPTVLMPGAVVALGGGAPLDDENWRLIAERSVTVFLDCEFDTVWQRTSGTTSRPLAAGRSRDELEALLHARLPRYREAVHVVDGDRPPDVVASEILEIWSD